MNPMTLYQKTRQETDRWLEGLFYRGQLLPRVAVFGATPFARYVASKIESLASAEVSFVLSDPMGEILDQRPMKPLTWLRQGAVDVVISGSLVNPQGQRQALADLGVTLPFHGIADGAHLCTEPRIDRCGDGRLEALRNRHAGQTVFVIGNGPSLNQTPPSRLGDEITLGGNGIFHHGGFSPSYYFVVDQPAVEWWEEPIAAQPGQVLAASHLEFRGRTPAHLTYFPACYEPREDRVDPLQLGVPTGHTIVSCMLYLACFMGASQAVLLGVDLDYRAFADGSLPYFSQQYWPDQIPRLSSVEAASMRERQWLGIRRAIGVVGKSGMAVVDASPFDNGLGVAKVPFNDVLQRGVEN